MSVKSISLIKMTNIAHLHVDNPITPIEVTYISLLYYVLILRYNLSLCVIQGSSTKAESLKFD